MPDIIITPSIGKLEFIDNSAQVTRRHSFTLDHSDGLVLDAPLSAAAISAPLNVINVTVNNSNVNYPFVLAQSGETGAKNLLMDGTGGTYNPFTNTATIDISGNSATTTLASDSTNLGGVVAASYVTLTGTQTLTNKTITGTFTGALTGTGSWATNAVSAVSATTSTNSTQLNGQAASYYTNIPARLGYTPVNQAGDTIAGNLTVNGNFTVNGSVTAFSASNIYLSSSVITVEDNILTLNAFSPYLRYAGIEMYDSGSGTLSQLLWDGDGDYFFLTGSSVNGKIITGPDGQTNLSSNYVPKATAGYKLGNSLIYDNGTNVGIGTTTPSGKLSTGATSGMKLLVYDNAATGVYTGLGQDLAAGNSTDLFAHSVSNLGFITFGKIGTNGTTYTEWARFNTSGNLGIGTTGPVAGLAVTPSGSAFDSTNVMVAYFGKRTINGYGSTFIRVAKVSNTTTTGSAEYTDIENNSGGSGPFRYGTYNDTNIINGGAATNGVYGSINFVTSGSTRMTIAGGTAAGNVGIGTTAPATTLHVVGVISGSSFSGAGTGLTGTAANLTAGTVTTNANLTGDVTSTGNATTIATNAVTTTKINSNSVTFAKFQQVAALSVVGVSGNSTANVAAIAGSANQVLRVSNDGTALAFGQVNLAQSQAVTGTLAINNGGTGAATVQLAINALAGAVTNGQYLRGNGTNVVMSAIQAADVPTLNQNTTGTAATATTVNGTNGQLLFKDIRAIAPNNIAAGYLQFGFTTWTNTLSTSPYADYLHLRSYTDSSGGNDNLVMFRKDAIGMRIWQQTFGSASNYSTYKDVCWTDGTNASGTWAITSSWATNAVTALNVGNGTITIAAGTGVGVGSSNTFTTNQSGATTVTITNTGVTAITTNTGLSTNASATGAVTITNTGVTSITTNTGLSTNASATGAVTITNTGVTSNVAGTGISLSGGTGAVTITNSSPNATHTGDVTGATTLTIANDAVTTAKILNSNVTLAKIANITAGTILGNNNASAAAAPLALTVAQVATMLSGQTMSIAGNAATATILQTARNIGGVSFNGSADINLPGVNTAGNQNTSGNAATATTATNANAISFTEVELNAPATTSGTWTTGNGSEWGEPKFGSTFNQFRYTDGDGPYVEYNVPANHHACFISQLQWDTGGYADCHGVQSDGDLVFLRRINTRQLVENSNHGNTIQHDGSTVTFVGSGLGSFTKIRITNRGGRIHMTGIAFTRQSRDGYEGTGMVHPAQISHQGVGSGLNADLLDGYNSATANTANTIVLRDASGNFSAGTITATLSGNVSGTAGGETFGTVTGRGSSTTTQISVGTTAGGSMYTGIKSGAGYSDAVSGATFKSITDHPTGGSYAFAAYFNGAPGTGTNSFFVAADGTGYFKGNVGIGTTSPSYRLQLGNLTAVSTATPEILSLGGTWSNSAGANVKLRVYDDNGTNIGGMNVSSGQMEVNTWSTGKLAFYRGTTQTAIIDASGNFGVGTSVPTAPLHVIGVISGSSFTGAGTGLTGTASGLSIGGSAATATSASFATTAATALNVGNGTITIAAGTGVGVGSTNTFTTNQSGATTVTITNNGVTAITTNTGLSTNASATGAVTITNTGVTSNVAGSGISLSGGTGAVTITNSSPNATHTGDVTGATALTIANDAVTTVKILNANVTNAKLANSSLTIGSTAISLGATATTIAGLSSVTSTTFVGALTGNASTATVSTYVSSLGSALNYDSGSRVTKTNGLSHYSGYSSGTNRPTTYDYTLQVTDGGKGWEISMDWISLAGPAIFARSLRDCCQGWSAWVRILDGVNYPHAANMNQYVRTTDNVTFGTVTAALSGNASTATTLQTARNIGGVSFNGSANIDLPGVNTAGNQNTSGNAATATNSTQLGGVVAARYVRNDTDGTAGDMFSLITVTKSLTVTTSWIDTGISAGSDLVSGAYILTLNVDNYAVSGGHYNETYTGTMYWYAGSTNSTDYDEIPLHKSGHAPNGRYINLRTLRGVSGVLKLQIISSVSTSGASNYIFKFRRMI